VASVVLAVELLLFEWKPRSILPVALASATAAATRIHLLGVGPVFAVPLHTLALSWASLAGCVVAGILAGVLSALLTNAVYASEDAFQRLPIHWRWWPPIGGLIIVLGGLIFPHALGVGYDVIERLLQGDVATSFIIGVLVVKSIIWSMSLGSGTSGGVLAPLLMMGAALGAAEARFLPAQGAGFWPLVSLGAVLAGTMRAPLTGVVFALELTHDVDLLLPLLVAVSMSYGFTVLMLKRSILTEKISRHGHHLSQEYSIDPLEIIFAREVARQVSPDVLADAESHGVIAFEDEPLRILAYRMAEKGLTRLPVMPRSGGPAIGVIELSDLLSARTRVLEAEQRRERTLGTRTQLRAIAALFGGDRKPSA
jgi:CIC family chloride channel protein